MEIVVTLDCIDTEAQAGFWLDALGPLGYRRAFDAPPYLSLTTPSSAPTLLLQGVPEVKQGKNRMHLDLRVEDFAGRGRTIGAAGRAAALHRAH